MARKETAAQGAVLRELEYLQNCGLLMYERTNNFSGFITRYRGGEAFTRRVSSGKRGSSDIKVYLPGGITLHLEMKSEKGTLRPEQRAWRDALAALGHKYAVCREVDDLWNILSVMCPAAFGTRFLEMNCPAPIFNPDQLSCRTR